MEILYKSETRNFNLEKDITQITDKSILNFDDLILTDNSLSCILTRHQDTQRIKLSIAGIKTANLNRNIKLDQYQILFGIKFYDKRLYLCSVEESQGIIGFELDIEVNTFNIKLNNI